MPEITALTVQRRRRNRVNVFLDGEYALACRIRRGDAGWAKSSMSRPLPPCSRRMP